MITEEFAERLFARMQEHQGSVMTGEELDTFTKLMSSDVMLKAFGMAFGLCRSTESEMASLNMAAPESIFQFTHGQGQIAGVNKVANGFLGMITEKPEEPDEDIPNE